MEIAANKILKEHNFNFKIKDRQLDVVKSVLDKLDTFAVLPTGYGKSVCYWLPPLILNTRYPDKHHTSLVISPLTALIREQVNTLNEHNLLAFGIFEGAERSHLEAIKDGSATILFVSPEAIVKKNWRRTIQDVYGENLCMIVYDEAHCISEWGLDFREDYRKVGIIHSVFDSPILALTATCSTSILADISTILGLKNLNVISCLPNRPNTTLCIYSCTENHEKELDWLVEAVRKQGKEVKKLILYVNYVAMCERIYIWLHTVLTDHSYCGPKDVRNYIIEMFHAKTDESSKERILDCLNDPNSLLRVLVATVAVGMGIDIPDISMVIMWGLPPSILQFWQECGRCGPDRRQSLALCYAYPRSLVFQCRKCRLRTCSCDERVHLKKALTTKDCQRVHCLRIFSISKQSELELCEIQRKQPCTKQCSIKCDCDMCKCCLNCILSCTCPKRNASLSDVIYQYINM